MEEVEAVNLKVTFVLMVLFMVLGTFALFDPLKVKEKKEEQGEKESLVLWLKDQKAKAIEIQSKTGKVRFECATEACEFDGTANWKVVQPVQDTADASNVGSLASSIKSLRVVDKIELETAPDPKEFGFDAPKAEVKLEVQGSADPIELKIGNASAVGNNVYLLSDTNPKTVYLVASYFGEMLEKDLFHWRNKRIFPNVESSDIAALSWSDGKKAVSAKKVDSSWKLEKPLQAKANQIMLEGLATTMAYLPAKSIYAESLQKAKNLGKPVWKVEVRHGKEGSPEVLTLYKAPSPSPNAREFVASTNRHKPLFLLDAVPFDRFAKNIEEYRFRKLLDESLHGSSEVMELTFPKEQKTIVLKRSGANWEYASGEKPAEALSQGRINSFFLALRERDVAKFHLGPVVSTPAITFFSTATPDLKVKLKEKDKTIAEMRFTVFGRRSALTEGELPGEARELGEDFLKALPVRFQDLYESSNKQVVVEENKGETLDGHDHSAHPHGHAH